MSKEIVNKMLKQGEIQRHSQIPRIPYQGEIWITDFNRKQERENFKIRPVLIMSNDWQNQYDKYSVIVPLTSDKEELKKNTASFEVLIEPNEKNGLDETNKILLNRLQIVDKNFRLIRKVGQVDSKIWKQVWRALWIVFTGKNL